MAGVVADAPAVVRFSEQFSRSGRIGPGQLGFCHFLPVGIFVGVPGVERAQYASEWYLLSHEIERSHFYIAIDR